MFPRLVKRISVFACLDLANLDTCGIHRVFNATEFANTAFQSDPLLLRIGYQFVR
ncbi:MAG: hypothetical protein P8P90_05700 [Opitutales bacterium]|nr:hypothetical protein [Opitutales bacterium]